MIIKLYIERNKIRSHDLKSSETEIKKHTTEICKPAKIMTMLHIGYKRVG